MNKLIQAVREHVVRNASDELVLEPDDVIAKIESGNREIYYNGFRDYHGPNRR